LTVEVSSSIEAAVCSSELACSSVREDRSWLPAAIWPEAVAMVSRAHAHFAHHLGQARVHVLQRLHQLARFVAAFDASLNTLTACDQAAGLLLQRLRRRPRLLPPAPRSAASPGPSA
jgi:hypothetical protein